MESPSGYGKISGCRVPLPIKCNLRLACILRREFVISSILIRVGGTRASFITCFPLRKQLASVISPSVQRVNKINSYGGEPQMGSSLSVVPTMSKRNANFSPKAKARGLPVWVRYGKRFGLCVSQRWCVHSYGDCVIILYPLNSIFMQRRSYRIRCALYVVLSLNPRGISSGAVLRQLLYGWSATG